MNRITAFEIAVAIVGAVTFTGIAAIAPPAYADDNPYHPAPIPVTETADHGQGSYCVKGRDIPAWTCDQALSTGGGYGTGTPDPTSAEKQAFIHDAETPKTPPAPPSPPGQPGGPVGGDL